MSDNRQPTEADYVSLTNKFRLGQMIMLLSASRTQDVARNIASLNSSIKTDALLEFIKRNMWRRAAEVVRCLVEWEPSYRAEIEIIFRANEAEKLLETPLEDLPTGPQFF